MLNAYRSDVLDNEQMRRIAPAIYAEAPAERTSERYAFVPTITVVDALRGEGWVPVFVAQGVGRTAKAIDGHRHVVRFKHASTSGLAKVGDSIPELVLKNSHDASSCYQLMAGLFRVVCGNGLVVHSANFGAISVRHTSVTVDEVVKASFSVLEGLPRIADSVERMRSIQLDSLERQAFANCAARLRWKDEEVPLEPTRLLHARRSEDSGRDLWSTYNVVQENLVKGGFSAGLIGRRRRVRALGSVDANLNVNKGLWGLTEELQKLRAQAAEAAA
jgi:hypothetical protein